MRSTAARGSGAERHGGAGRGRLRLGGLVVEEDVVVLLEEEVVGGGLELEHEVPDLDALSGGQEQRGHARAVGREDAVVGVEIPHLDAPARDRDGGVLAGDALAREEDLALGAAARVLDTLAKLEGPRRRGAAHDGQAHGVRSSWSPFVVPVRAIVPGGSSSATSAPK